MKKSIPFIFMLLLVIQSISAQVPQKISYQAVIRNSSNSLVASQAVKMRITIIKGSATGTEVYVETHNPTTNANGIVNVEIGGGTVVSGIFANIDWANGSTFVKTETDPTGGTNYTLTGTSQLLTVPYAMVANKLSGPVSKMEVKSETSSLDEALFEVKNKNGQTVFAVYNEGVRIYVDNGSKGKGGFSVGGFANTKAGSQDLLVVSPDSIRAYVGTDPTGKGAKGGFAISSFGNTKATSQDLWVVNPDSIRAYVGTDLTGKGAKGGFAISSFGNSKSSSQELLVVSPDSIRAYVSDEPDVKGKKGGFAISSFGSAKGISQELLNVNPDSIRAFIASGSQSKGKKGGFAISGFNDSKAGALDFIRVTTDSTRIYLPEGSVKGQKGGFAISSFGSAKGSETNYFYLNQDSTRFYVLDDGSGSQSSFNIVGIGSNFQQKPLFTARPDTIKVGGFLNVQNDLKVQGNIGYTGNASPLSIPEVYSSEPSNITESSVDIWWEIFNNGGATITASGVVWGTSANPTIALPTKTNDKITSGSHTTTITGLAPNTTYYARAYATNSEGTAYSFSMTFTTNPLPVTINDIDGNVYQVVTIGAQNWIRSDLKTARLNDGTAIANVSDDATWSATTDPAYAWYSNDHLAYPDYGMLYNWATVNTGLLCPVGWHVPTEADWMELATTLGGTQYAGGALKETGTIHWLDPNTGATNTTGFTALPGGLRAYLGPFAGVGQSGNWWSSSRISVDPTSVTIGTGSESIMIQMSMDKFGMSVRCLQNAK